MLRYFALGRLGEAESMNRGRRALADVQVQPERNAAVEWPTLGLFALIHGAWLALVWFHDALPIWLWLPLAAWISAWWGSAQHEALHGHPTRLKWLNTALATPPFWLWLPFERYRQTHLKHHHDERLTDPLDDPESRYETPDGWTQRSALGRLMVRAQMTLLGRLVIGPVWAVGAFWRHEALSIAAGDRQRLKIWLWHVPLVALVLVFALGVAGMPLWQYLLGFVYFGTALALVRSFAEHKAEEAVEKRTAIVERSPILGLLFLHNNLHVAHHKWPSVAWYRLPGLYARHREALVRENGGLVYDGYGDVFRRFFLRSYMNPVHPLGRAPERPTPVSDSPQPSPRGPIST
jgi:fatty acid desaturase